MKLVRRTNSYYPSFANDFFGKNWIDLFNLDSTLDRTALPKVNIRETNDDYELEVAAPGLDKKNFKVEVDNNILKISYEAKDNKNEDTDQYSRIEFSRASFSRSFRLPENEIDTDNIHAKYEDGILRVKLPKLELAKVEKNRMIEIS